jgi:hypothetical protein
MFLGPKLLLLKGQKISKAIFLGFNSSKKPTKKSLISALASKKWLTEK